MCSISRAMLAMVLISAKRGVHMRSVSWVFCAKRAILVASSPMRSKSVMVLIIIKIMRKSLAAGWRRAIMWLQSSSTCTSKSLTRWSFLMTFSANWVLDLTKDSKASTICCSTKLPISRTLARTDSSSASYCLYMCSDDMSNPYVNAFGEVKTINQICR